MQKYSQACFSTKQIYMPLGAFLTSLLQALYEEGVKPCILRNYEEFPDNNTGHDIDFLIHASESSAALRALRSVSEIRIVGCSVRPSVVITFSEGISQASELRALQVDFIMKFSWKGLSILSTETILEAAIPHQTGNLKFFVPSPVHEAIISLFSSLLVGGWLKEKYFPQVQRTFSGNRLDVIASLSPQFGLQATTQLVDMVINGDRNKLLGCVPRLRASLGMRSLLHRPVCSSLEIIQHYSSEFALRFFPRTLETVCIINSNRGSQETIVDDLIPMLQSTAKIVEARHSGQQLTTKSEISEFDISTENRVHMLSGIFVVMVNIVLWLAMEWRSQFTEKKNLTLRICESRYYDLLINDQKLRQLHLPVFFSYLIVKMLPNVDLWILLDSSVKETIGRERFCQLKVYKAHVKRKEEHIILDASMPEPVVAEEAYAAIIDTLARRANRQLQMTLLRLK
jgi:hypothetical protein